MSDVARNEWHLTEHERARLLMHVVIEPLDVTPFRRPCQAWSCSKDAHRERVADREYPYVFVCEYGHTTPSAADLRY